ncbi:MAG: lamin tail domain-containing protein, partial [bacterium]|nr:lamin tail domain-containing protein [bacterium]
FKEENKISSGGLYLLERTDDNSAPGVTADAIYAGALSNNGAYLKIFDADCNLSDEIDASKKWPAGDSAARKTMERSVLDFSWHTSNYPGGTPKKENSTAFSKGAEGMSQPADSPSTDNQTTSTPDSQIQNQASAHILIAEIQITGGSGKTTNDFIKIFNSSSAPFNLKGYRLIKRTKTGTSDTSIKSWTADAFVPASGYYTWANSSFTALMPPPDVTTSGSIANDNSIAIRQGSENSGTIIDAVAWGAAQNGVAENDVYPLNPDANKILSRKSANGILQDTNNNQNDFEIK